MIEVALALVWQDGRLLVTRRRPDVHLGGLWEFPGGKLRTNEDPEIAAAREVLEETGVVARPRGRRAPIEWQYPERTVRLHPVDCDWVEGHGEPLEVSELRWVTVAELAELELPPANAALVAELSGR